MIEKKIKEFSKYLLIGIPLFFLPMLLKYAGSSSKEYNIEKRTEKAISLTPTNSTFRGYIPLYDIIEYKNKAMKLFSLNELKDNSLPTKDWNKIKEIKKNKNIDFSKNNKFFVYTRNKL